MSTVNSWRQSDNGVGNAAQNILQRRSRNTPSLSSTHSGSSLSRELGAVRNLPPRQASINNNSNNSNSVLSSRSHLLQRSMSMPVPDNGSSEFVLSNNNGPNYSKREAGYIEKLLHSYGFIQGSDREVRLFFHFSEIKTDAPVQVGDPVEFRQSTDRRTGKPIAVSIVKKPLSIHTAQRMQASLSDKLVSGVVLVPARVVMACNGTGDELEGGDEKEKGQADTGLGRITYEQSGETFFLSFAVEDVVIGQDVDAGDKVEFYMVADEQYSNLRAKSVRRSGSTPLVLNLSTPSLARLTSVSTAPPLPLEQYQGLVSCMKDNYGFINRADVVKEIFFHHSEFLGDLDELHMGDDVQFTIQTRNGKDVAVGITLLPAGTVVFEDVHEDRYRGTVELPTKQTLGSRRQSESAPPVRIVYKTEKGAANIICNERDNAADFTLFDGDTVDFNLATDRRDGHVRPTNVTLVQDLSFKHSKESRERAKSLEADHSASNDLTCAQPGLDVVYIIKMLMRPGEKGFVTTLKEGFGFIRCTDREARMFFHFKEKLDAKSEMELQQEVQFTVVEDPSNCNRLIAVRIKALPTGSIPSAENCSQDKHTGTVEKEANVQLHTDTDPGIIMYDVSGTKQTLPYSSFAVDGELPRLRDKVEFQISECVKNGTKTAVNVRVCARASLPRERGHIVTLKDSFGFIEMSDHQHEIFFHFSCVEGSADDLDLGDEVEFTVSHKSARICAENIRRLSSSTSSTSSMSASNKTHSSNEEVVLPGMMEGKIVRSIRFNGSADHTDYCGLIQAVDADSNQNNSGDGGVNTGSLYTFSITSLVDKRESPQKGDLVRYQIAVGSDNKMRAVNVALIRRFMQCKVTSIKDTTATVDYELDGVAVTFNTSELQDNAVLVEGDTVEFVVVQGLKGASTIHSVRKIYEKPRPERLLSRLKSVSDDNTVPRVITVRQPRGPDGSPGFRGDRPPWTPPPPSPLVCSSAPGVAIRAPWSISGPLASCSSFDDPSYGTSSSATNSPSRGSGRDKKPLCREDSGAVFE